MALVSFDKNDVVRISTTFTDTSDAVADPTDVSCVVKAPSGTETTSEYNPGDIVRDSTGIYHLDVTASASGTWVYRFTGTGAVAQVDEGEFYVLVSDLSSSATLAGWNEMREMVFTVVRDSSRDLVTETDVDLWLTEGMRDLSSRLHLTQNSKTQVDSAISSNLIDIPSDYVELIWLKLEDEPVVWTDEETFNSYQESGGTLSTTIGRVFNGNFELYPTPTDTDYTLRYWSSSTAVAGFTGTLRARLINYARAHAKWKEGEMGHGDRYMELYERALPTPNDLGQNRFPGPFEVHPAPGWFDSAEYLN